MLYLLIFLGIIASIITLCFVVFLLNIILQAFLWYGVPFVPTPDYKVNALLKHLTLSTWQKFLDVWCGDGKIIEAVSQKYPQAQVHGIENSPYPYLLAKKRQKRNNMDFHLHYGNFFSLDISEYDIIYAYLIPYMMPKIWKKVITECKPGTLLYSSSFQIPDVPVIEKIHISDDKYFYVYQV